MVVGGWPKALVDLFAHGQPFVSPETQTFGDPNVWRPVAKGSKFGDGTGVKRSPKHFYTHQYAHMSGPKPASSMPTQLSRPHHSTGCVAEGSPWAPNQDTIKVKMAMEATKRPSPSRLSSS